MVHVWTPWPLPLEPHHVLVPEPRMLLRVWTPRPETKAADNDTEVILALPCTRLAHVK